VKDRSDFFVPCSGVETLLYFPHKPHQHISHHKTPFLQVNAMSKLPGADTPDNHQDEAKSDLPFATSPS